MSDDHYTITLDHERRLVRVTAQGEFEIKTGNELITKSMNIAAEHQYNILCDVRASRAKADLGDWFFLPRRLGVYKDLRTRSTRSALLVSPGRQENAYRFFETVAINVGLKIKIFLEEEEALEWLEEQS
jgi:hypothetical protein